MFLKGDKLMVWNGGAAEENSIYLFFIDFFLIKSENIYIIY